MNDSPILLTIFSFGPCMRFACRLLLKNDFAIFLNLLYISVAAADADPAAISVCSHLGVNGNFRAHVIQSHIYPAFLYHLFRFLIIFLCDTS